MSSIHNVIFTFFISSMAIASPKLYKSHAAENCDLLKVEHQYWCLERKHRELEIEKYYANNPIQAEALLFKTNGGGQVPFILFRLFQEMFPEIWGDSSNQYQTVGLGKNVFDPQSLLPLGIAKSAARETLVSLLGETVKINKVNLTCIACHSGQVRLDDGNLQTLVGAPSTRINNMFFTFANTASRLDFNAVNFRSLIRSKPRGWFYQDPQMLKTEDEEVKLLLTPLVLEEMITKVKIKSEALLTGFEFIRPFLYQSKNAPDPFATKRGSLDGLIPTYLTFLQKLINPFILLQVGDYLPSQAAEIDPPSIWLQRKKGPKHWDGTQPIDLHRNIGAAAANLNQPLDIENIHNVSEFIQDLPSDPYPFDVDYSRALRGKVLFANNCSSCHAPVNQVFDKKIIGTDPNRIFHFTKKITPIQGEFLAKYCSDKKFCLKSNGSSYLPSELATEAFGYVAGSLEGIWARAPYLHNGSVPTLAALLTGERPTYFYRGNLNYDTADVGFVWDKNSSGAILYNTLLDGNSNEGHSNISILGINWKTHPEELHDLLEYLKTL